MSGYNRHNEVPIYEIRPGQVSALHYNHVHVALRRSDEPLRLEIPRLKTLDLILQSDAWILVDRAFNDIPVIAWCEFQTTGRSALHLPIDCSIRLFHANAGILLKRVPEAMEMLLGEKFSDESLDAPDTPIRFKPRDS